jgi:hypothetical protein
MRRIDKTGTVPLASRDKSMSDTTNSSSPEYFVRRAAVARATAEKCEDRGVAAIHLEMASKYDEMAAGDEPRLNLVQVEPTS